MASAAPLLRDVIARCRALSAGPRRPVVVFDLDGTLFDNGPRTWQILVDFAEETDHYELRRALDELPRRGLPYLLKDTLQRLGFAEPGLIENAALYWRAHFFTDDHQRYDEPIPGARHYVQELFDA